MDTFFQLLLNIKMHIGIITFNNYINNTETCVEGEKGMFYYNNISTHFTYCYIALDIWPRTTQPTRKEGKVLDYNMKSENIVIFNEIF